MPQPVQTTTGAGASGVMHAFNIFRGDIRTVLHPLQRSGQVAYDSHALMPVIPAAGHPGIGDTNHAAAAFNMPIPPGVPIQSAPGNWRNMV